MSVAFGHVSERESPWSTTRLKFMQTYVLGIDVGTGGTRALIMGGDGRVFASATAEHEPFASPQPGWAEQRPEDWWRAAGIAIHKALEKGQLRGEQISCVGFSGQMHGAVMLDARSNVVRPALIWCDVRTEKQCRELTERVGAEQLIRLTCNPALANFTVTKLLWTRENEPENWKRVRSVLLPKDYVRFRLTGERATDVADASGTLLLNVARRQWSAEVLQAAEIDRSLLPALYESADVCGKVSVTGAEATGLSVGTSGVVFAATDRPALDSRGRLHAFCHAVPERWHVMGVTQAAGLSLRWFRDQFACVPAADGRDPYEQLTAEAAPVPPGADGLLWAPYLMGERTPHLDPAARGVLAGLTASHTRAHVIRAILEGVAFSLKDTFAIFAEMNVPVKNVRLGGGGARSSLWRQIQADVYGQQVEIVEAEEGAAFGAAILAGVGAKMWPSVDAACDSVVRVVERISPIPTNVAVMNAAGKAYRRIYPAMKSIFAS